MLYREKIGSDERDVADPTKYLYDSAVIDVRGTVKRPIRSVGNSIRLKLWSSCPKRHLSKDGNEKEKRNIHFDISRLIILKLVMFLGIDNIY